MGGNGCNLQGMDKGFLKSLEEMTLHSIIQKKEINTQKVQIQALATELVVIKETLLNHK
jgi:hypothetical protein